MAKFTNLTFRVIYFVLMVIPVSYFFIATYSYFSVLSALGDVPPYKDLLDKLSETKNISPTIFPIHSGELLLTAVFWTYLIFPVAILVNYISHKISPKILYYRKHAIALAVICIASIFFLFMDPFGRWYTGLILD